MPYRCAFTKTTSRIIFVTLALAFLIGCSDDEAPAVFGNDGATLNNLNIKGALALISNSEGKRVEDAKGQMSFPASKLYTLSKSGVLAELPVTFSGNPNGGTDHYIVYPINERYSILSFYTRTETYIIDQVSGEVHKSVYIPMPENCVAGHDDLYFGDLYAFNIEGVSRGVKVSNFLSADAIETEVLGGSALYILDKDDNLYSFGYGSAFYVSYHGTGDRTNIATGIAGIFNDHDNELNMVSVDGDVSSLKSGAIHAKVSLKDVSLTGTLFQAYAFPEQKKTLAVAQDNVSHSTMLYDIISGEKKLNISTLENGNFNMTAGSALGKYLFFAGRGCKRRAGSEDRRDGLFLYESFSRLIRVIVRR